MSNGPRRCTAPAARVTTMSGTGCPLIGYGRVMATVCGDPDVLRNSSHIDTPLLFNTTLPLMSSHAPAGLATPPSSVMVWVGTAVGISVPPPSGYSDPDGNNAAPGRSAVIAYSPRL